MFKSNRTKSLEEVIKTGGASEARLKAIELKADGFAFVLDKISKGLKAIELKARLEAEDLLHQF